MKTSVAKHRKPATLCKFLIRKYVYAETAEQAIRLDRKTPVRDVVLQEAQVQQTTTVTEAVGFQLELAKDENE